MINVKVFFTLTTFFCAANLLSSRSIQGMLGIFLELILAEAILEVMKLLMWVLVVIRIFGFAVHHFKIWVNPIQGVLARSLLHMYVLYINTGSTSPLSAPHVCVIY